MSIKNAEKVFLALCLAMAASAASAGLCDDGGGSDNDYNSGKEV